MQGRGTDRWARGPLTALGHVIAQIFVTLWVIADAILTPLFRPLMRWLSRLRLIQAIERGIASLPAYGVLALLAAPFAVEELAKVYAFVLMGGGHFKSGALLYIACHVFAILVCERIYRAGEDKLMTIAWFARLMTWLKGYKDRLIAWVKGTDLYRRAMLLKERLKQQARAFLSRTRAALRRAG